MDISPSIPRDRPWSGDTYPTPPSMAVGCCWMPGGTHTHILCGCLCPRPQSAFWYACNLKHSLILPLQRVALSLSLCSAALQSWNLLDVAPSVPLHQIWLKLLSKGLRKGGSLSHRKRKIITGILMLSRKNHDLYGRQKCAWGKAAS